MIVTERRLGKLRKVIQMTKEQNFFIQILSDHLGGRETAPPEDGFDWSALYSLSHAHEVDGIVYSQCGRYVPDELRAKYERGYAAATFFYGNRVSEVKRICDAFRETGVQYYTIKGLDVAKYYPFPALRTMGDNDFVVSDMPAAIRALRSHGYEGNEDENVHEWSFDRNGMHFEVHDQLVKYDEFTTKTQDSFFRDFMPYAKDGALDPNYHFMFLLMHLRKHLISYGVGIRQFMDLAVMIKNEPGLDPAWLEKDLLKTGLDRFARSCFYLIDSWFGIKALIKYDRIDSAEKITEHILKSGVFGGANKENIQKVSQNQLVLGTGSRFSNRARSLLRSTFPPYEMMSKYPGCRFIEGKKYLLPAAWVKRFGYLIVRKDHSASKRTIEQSFTSNEELKERGDLLRNMGL